MSDRQVTQSGKGDGNVITKLCNPGQIWSPVSKDRAIADIEGSLHTYYALANGKRADIHVVKVDGKKHLRTDPDGKGKNNLENLPDC